MTTKNSHTSPVFTRKAGAFIRALTLTAVYLEADVTTAFFVFQNKGEWLI